MPSVSVVIPAYNRADTVKAAVESALGQSYKPLEIIVVDDASSDDPAKALTDFHGSIRIIRHMTNRGAGAARNTGIDAAAGDYIAFLDSDDRWMPDKTARQIEFMKKHGFVMSCTGFSSIYGSGAKPMRKERPYKSTLSVRDIVWGIYVAPGTTLIAERQLFRAIGGYDASLPRLEDWELLLKATLHAGELGFLDENLAILQPSEGPSIETLQVSARLLLERGVDLLSKHDPGLVRSFRAGVAFQLAAVYWKRGAYAKSIISLLESIGNVGVGNQSIRIILIPWLKDLILRRRDG